MLKQVLLLSLVLSVCVKAQTPPAGSLELHLTFSGPGISDSSPHNRGTVIQNDGTNSITFPVDTTYQTTVFAHDTGGGPSACIDTAYTPTATFTLCSMVYPESYTSGNNVLVASNIAPTTSSLSLYITGGQLTLEIIDNVGTFYTATGSHSVPLNTWTQLCGTFDGSVMQTFFNGVQDSSFTITPSISWTTSYHLAVGSNGHFTNSGYNALNGRLYQVYIYSAALNAAQISTLIPAAATTVPPTTPVPTTVAPTTQTPMTVGPTTPVPTTTVPTTQAPTATPASLQLYLTFNLQNFRDSSLYNRTVTQVGNVSSTFQFDNSYQSYIYTQPNAGGNEYLDTTFIPSSPSSFTLCSMVRPFVANAGGIFASNASPNAQFSFDFSIRSFNHFVMLITTDVDQFQVLSGLNVVPFIWYHACAVYDITDTSMKLYINGTLDTTTSVGPSGWTSSFRVNIGSDGHSATAFQGSFDEIRIYSTALTQPQITALIPQVATSAPPTTVAPTTPVPTTSPPTNGTTTTPPTNGTITTSPPTAPTTASPTGNTTTQAPTTPSPTTQSPTSTPSPTTASPTTHAPTTPGPTIPVNTTLPPTTASPTTTTTAPPTTAAPTINGSTTAPPITASAAASPTLNTAEIAAIGVVGGLVVVIGLAFFYLTKASTVAGAAAIKSASLAKVGAKNTRIESKPLLLDKRHRLRL